MAFSCCLLIFFFKGKVASNIFCFSTKLLTEVQREMKHPEAQRELATQHAAVRAEREATAKREAEKARLAELIYDTEQALALEHQQKERMRHATVKLRERVASIKALANVLETQERSYTSFSNEVSLTGRMSVQEQRRQQVTDHSDGMLTFHKMEGANPDRLPPVGRSVRRTAYTTTYNNQRILGEREADGKEKQLRRVAEKMAAQQQQQQAAVLAGSSSNSLLNASTSNPHLQGAPSSSFRSTHELYSSLGYTGGPSQVNLDTYQKRSSGRTRFYQNYNGDRIMMDVCDWPTANGVVFRGL